MKVYELMQRIGARDTNLVIAYIKDAFRSIEEISRENIASTYIDIVQGVEDYHFPSDMVKLVSLKIDVDIADAGDYYWEVYGRFIKLWKKDYSGELVAPDSNETNGIFIEYTSTGKMFAYNPDGDSDTYTYTTANHAEDLVLNDIVYVDPSSVERADAMLAGHYYKKTSYNKITSGDIVVGKIYRISAYSVLDFTALGASASTVGVKFKCTVAGTMTTVDNVELMPDVIETGTLTVGNDYMIFKKTSETFANDGASAETAGTTFRATASTVTLSANDSVLLLTAWVDVGMTSTTKILNTLIWTDYTEIASPDEDSYINISDSYIDAIEEYVRMKLSDKTDDIKLKTYREQQFLKKHSRARKMNSGGPKLIYPRSPFSFK